MPLKLSPFLNLKRSRRSVAADAAVNVNRLSLKIMFNPFFISLPKGFPVKPKAAAVWQKRAPTNSNLGNFQNDFGP
jgi:hypothetical protein